MPYSDLVTQKEAAVILNRSVSAVSRAIKAGRLEYADPKNRLLHRPGLEERFRRKTRPRSDKPQRKAQLPVPGREEPKPISTTCWDRAAQKLAYVLEGAPAYWARAVSEPDGDDLRLFCRVLDEVKRQCEIEKLEQS